MSNDETYPGVDLAYDFIRPSYEWSINRLDAVKARIQQLQGFAATVTVAAPVLAKAVVTDISLNSGWFYAAVGLFLAVIVMGLYANTKGTLKLLSPRVLYDKYLHKRQWEFKKDALWWAAEAFEHNRALVNRKGNIAIAMTVAFMLEIICFVIWILIA